MAENEHTLPDFLTRERIELVRRAICEQITWTELLSEISNDTGKFEIIGPTIFARLSVLGTVMLCGVDDRVLNTAQMAVMLEPIHASP